MASDTSTADLKRHQPLHLPTTGIKDLFNSCPLGIIELDAESRISYANKAALRIIGLEGRGYEGLSIHGLLPDKETLETFEKHFAERMGGASEEYDLDFLHQNGSRIPVRVVGVPVKDGNGKTIGSIGILRSLRLERTASALDTRVKESTTAQEIFLAIAEEVAKVEPYDFCAAWMYNEQLTEARDLFTFDRRGAFKWPKKWYRILPQRIQWIRQHTDPGVNDEFIAMRHEYAAAMKDPSIEGLMQHLSSAYRVPVVRKAQVIGSMSFFRQAANAFDKQADENLRALSLEKAFLVALAYLEKEDLQFSNTLMQQLAAYEGIDLFDKRIAELIVQRLSEHYGWDVVAIFRVNVEQKRFELEAQAGRPDVLVGQAFTQQFGQGILARSYESGQPVYTSDWKHDPIHGPLFKAAYKGTVSELCAPIPIEDEIVAMLNVEDSRQNAISDAEMEKVIDLLKRISQQMEAQRTAKIATVAFESTPSGVLIVGEDGRISRANPAALRMLGYECQELKGKPLTEVVQPETYVVPMLQIDTPSRDDLHLVHKNGKPLRVMMASTRLGNGMGTIVSAKDITGPQRLAELDYLDKLFYDIAAQTRVPLSLATAWLQRLKKRFEIEREGLAQRDTVIDAVSKTLKQLKKAEITYDRLSLYNKNFAAGMPRNPIVFSVGRLMDDIKSEFPDKEAARIAVHGRGVLGNYIDADLYQASFAVLATVSYAIRFTPESRPIDIRVEKQFRDGRNWVVLSISAVAPHLDSVLETPTDKTIVEAKTEVALGTRIIQTFIEQNGGLYHGPTKLEGNIKFEFSFPIAEGAQLPLSELAA